MLHVLQVVVDAVLVPLLVHLVAAEELVVIALVDAVIHVIRLAKVNAKVAKLVLAAAVALVMGVLVRIILQIMEVVQALLLAVLAEHVAHLKEHMRVVWGKARVQLVVPVVLQQAHLQVLAIPAHKDL